MGILETTTRRSRIWLLVGGLFGLVNVAGGVYALVEGEPMHAGAHVVALLLTVYLMRRTGRRLVTRDVSRDVTDRLTRLEHALDAVALEVERIGEGQRYMTQLLTGKVKPPVPRE